MAQDLLSCLALLEALDVPWAHLDAQGRVQAFHPRFSPVPESQTGTPLSQWFPQVPWPPEGEPPWKVSLDPGRTLYVWPLPEEGYLAVLHLHGTGLATLPVPSGKSFLNMLVHELRLPLTPIRGYGELMKQGLLGEVTDKQREVLETMLSNIARMNRLLDRLSVLGKVETGVLPTNLQAVPVRVWVTDKAREHRPAFEEVGLSLEVECPSEMPAMWTDPSGLGRILDALLENARMYTPTGGKVRVEARVHKGLVELAVVDNGIGIAEEEQALVFQPFFRSSDERVRRRRGWGMDLFVAYRLARYLGGDLGFTSQPERGSRFWVRVPIAAS